MSGYSIVNLSNMLEELEEEEVKKILSSFSCLLNKDVEEFLKNKAIEFSKQGLASTHLVLTSYKGKPVIIGYFSLANKYFTIKRKTLSNSLARKIVKFGQYNEELRRYIIGAPLIGQIGKNYSNNYNKLIKGDELLKIACDKIKAVQLDMGGKIVYLECEDKSKLIEFYKDNGFVDFGKRSLDKDETDSLDGDYLVQMLKYLKK